MITFECRLPYWAADRPCVEVDADNAEQAAQWFAQDQQIAGTVQIVSPRPFAGMYPVDDRLVRLQNNCRLDALEQRLQALEARITMPNVYRCTDGALEPWDVEATSPQQAAEIFAGSFDAGRHPNQVIVTDEAGKKHHYLINLRYSAALV